jgi:perosamine synthetase
MMGGGAIQLSPVHLGEEEERLVLEVLRSGRLAQGPMVERLEAAFRELVGTTHAVAVNSGTSALVAALQALELGPGDEVITSPFTFAATLNAIIEVGATARFADILDADFTVDPRAVEAYVGPRTAAIMPVHLYGHPADMAGLAQIATRHGLSLVEDAAQAHGAKAAGRAVGSFGLGCFSFYATKNIATGEGGMVTTDEEKLADRIRLLRNQGTREPYGYEIRGHNYRMSELHAAVGLPQVSKLPDRNRRRAQNAARLSASLAGMPDLQVPATAPGRTHAFHQYTIRVTRGAPERRDRLAARLAELGIETKVYYPRVVYDYPCFRSHPQVRRDPAPRAEAAAREVLSLPVHPWLSDQDLDRIVEGVRSVAHSGPRNVPG